MIKSVAAAVIAARTAFSQPFIPTAAQVFANNTPALPQETSKLRADTDVMLRAPLAHPQSITLPRFLD